MNQAVITGDVIHSTSLSVDERIALSKHIQTALKIWEKDFVIKSEFFQGDSFQCYIGNAQSALKVALILKTYIRSLNPTNIFDVSLRQEPDKKKGILFSNTIIDARMAIGIGASEHIEKKLANSHGIAFTLSGHLLDDMKNTKQKIAIATNDEFNDELVTAFILLDALLSKTTALQCQVLNLKLLGYNETAIARQLKILQSAINQRSQAGNWNAINALVKRFETIYDHEQFVNFL